jgi:hypothetical protein
MESIRSRRQRQRVGLHHDSRGGDELVSEFPAGKEVESVGFLLQGAAGEIGRSTSHHAVKVVCARKRTSAEAVSSVVGVC